MMVLGSGFQGFSTDLTDSKVEAIQSAGDTELSFKEAS